MSAILTIPEIFPLGGSWSEKGGSWWLTPESATAREVARKVLGQGGRLISITATELPGQGVRMDYHWDLEGTLLTFTFIVEKQAESIFDLCPAADWIEREIREYFAIEFAGRTCEPLFLRSGQKLGVNLREEDE